ncbi:ribosome maturation factor RimP [Christensenellaceae bacterium 44-20]
MSRKIEEQIERLVGAKIEQMGYELVDVEYAKVKGQDDELVVYIDRQGGVTLDDCEAVSLAVEPIIDEADPIAHAYVFCVSSPGIDRPLKKPRDFEKALQTKVDLKLYEKLNGKKEITAVLIGYDESAVRLQTEKGQELELGREKIALIRPHIEF